MKRYKNIKICRECNGHIEIAGALRSGRQILRCEVCSCCYLGRKLKMR